jgi:hypothetical protein
MKKALSIVTGCALLVVLLTGCSRDNGADADSITFTAVIEEVRDSSILVSTEDDVGFDLASVKLPEGLETSFNLIAGQTVILTVLPQIAESYPVRVTAAAVELVTDKAQVGYPITYIRADGSRDDSYSFIASLCENSEALLISGVQHLPALCFSDTTALEDFIHGAVTYYQLGTSFERETSFVEAAGKYDDVFFRENALVVFLAPETSGSNRHSVESVSHEDEVLSVAVRRIAPEIGTADMADWFILLEIPKTELEGCSYADAYIIAG